MFFFMKKEGLNRKRGHARIGFNHGLPCYVKTWSSGFSHDKILGMYIICSSRAPFVKSRINHHSDVNTCYGRENPTRVYNQFGLMYIICSNRAPFVKSRIYHHSGVCIFFLLIHKMFLCIPTFVCNS